MEEPPAVPPKDPWHTPLRMERQRPSTAAKGGSKRKRDGEFDASYESDLEFKDDDGTPNKRSRSKRDQGEASATGDAPSTQPRSVRRKKGSHNLSNLNLRHAARTQTPSNGTVRDSKFQEGSLSDKPSEKPPTFFTRFARLDSGNSAANVDSLMSDYHDEIMTPTGSQWREKLTVSPNAYDVIMGSDKKDEGKTFFQFGRQLASNFRPVALWKSIWNDSKEELRKEDMEEAERKAKLKADAEAKYKEMKQAGQFTLQPNSNIGNTTKDSRSGVWTPRDSGVAFDGMQSSIDQSRTASAITVLRHDVLADSNVKQSRGLRDRLHLKKPSLQNLKSDLRRMKSDFNLAAVREPSSSVSPVKTDLDNSRLKKSASRADLRKQHKLSKRVSDLEYKLELARLELHEALEEASPMPKLPNRYERYTPAGTLKRPKFLPGNLPSLPSERIMMAEESTAMNAEGNSLLSGSEHSVKPIGITFDEYLAKAKEEEGHYQGEGEEKIKPSRAQEYPPRASAIFELEATQNNTDNNIENQTPPDEKQAKREAAKDHENLSEGPDDMDPNSVTSLAEGAKESIQAVDYGSLDAKLKALDANVKTARKVSQPKKKRKMGEKDQVFKPGNESDEDAEWEETTPRKKRKSSGKTDTSPPNKRSTRARNGAQSSPTAKKNQAAAGKTKSVKSSPPKKTAEKEQANEADEPSPEDDENGGEIDEDTAHDSIDTSAILDNSGLLDPVYEEEEETATAASNDAKPTSTTIPAITKSNGDMENEIITRAAHAAQNHPGRKGRRSVSPLPPNGHAQVSKITTEEEIVTVVPGANGVPKLPKGANSSFESPVDAAKEATQVGVINPDGKKVEMTKGDGKKEAFEWPDDVF